ncbi:MAG: YCF48-related protein [Gammaproteobacteria bacterium]|nr:MAG: YCF48-related protein [Gammaproteobacteria bacterium]
MLRLYLTGSFITGILIASLLWTLSAAASEQSEPARLASRSLLLDITHAGTRLVTVGERGHVLVSDDSGKSWQQKQVPTRSQLTAVFFIDERVGWAVGLDAVILSTVDGGDSWVLQHRDKQYDDPLLDVWFKDRNNGFAIGAYGLFLSTNDGGKSWDRRQISEDDFHLNAISSLNSNELFIAAEQGHLYHSIDGGYSWTALPSPYAGSFFGINVINDELLLVFGLRGNLFSSNDKGETWQKIESGTEASLMAALQQKNGTIRIVGLVGNILTSTDQGKSFSLKVREDRKTLTSIVEAADGKLVMSGSAGITVVAGDSK